VKLQSPLPSFYLVHMLQRTLPAGFIAPSWPDLGRRWPARLVATAAANRLNIRRNLHTSLAVRWAAVSEQPIWLAVIAGCGRSSGPRFRLSSVDRRHQSSVGMGVPSSAPSCLPQRHPSGAYEEGLAGMLTIIKASLLASALMLLESCTGYLTSYQTPCVEGHVCECVRYTTVNRSWLDCRDYGRVKSRAY